MPRILPHLQIAIHIQPCEGPRRARAHDDLIPPPLEPAPLHHHHVPAHVERLRLHAAQRHIRVRAGRAFRQIHHHEQLRRRERPVLAAGHARRVGDRARLVAREDARHLAVRARAQDHGDIGHARDCHHAAKTFRDCEHADEHRDHAGDAHGGGDSGPFSLGQGAEIEKRDGENLGECIHKTQDKE